MSRTYLYRRGDGNEGNFVRFLVILTDKDDPYAALRALVANDYIAERRHIIQNIDVNGDAEYSLHAAVHEGPEGERAFDAAWLTADLQRVSEADKETFVGLGQQVYELRKVLDNAALRHYRADARSK